MISYFLANQSKHEFGLQKGFQGGKSNAKSMQNRAQNAIITQLEGSGNDKGRSEQTSKKIRCIKGKASSGQDTVQQPLTQKQSVPV